MSSPAEDVLGPLARLIARAVVEELRPKGEWVDQHESELGPRLHCAAVRRRRAEGLGGAAIKGRRHLLTREALQEEMMRCPKPGLRKCRKEPGTTPSSREARVQATVDRLRLIRRGKE